MNLVMAKGIRPARLLLLAAALACALAGHAAACDEKIGRDFPSATPAAVGLSARPLVALNDALDAGKYDVRALLVLKDCKLIVERYKDGLSREHNHSVYSVTKSVAATLVGALLHERKLRTLDVPVADIVPRPDRVSDANWSKAREITLKNAMQMSSGLVYRHDPAGHPIYDPREDRLAVALTPELGAQPGTRFQYSDGDVSITGAVIAAAAGDDLLSYGKRTLFEPLQMANYAWMFRDRAGRYPGGWGLRLRPIDMAKLGQLYLQQGEWNGKQIFAASFPAIAWQAGVSPAYALHWWVGNNAAANGVTYFYANGFKGQRIYVFPTHRAVVTVISSLPSREENAVMPLVIRALTESVAQGKEPADSSIDARLKEQQAAGFRGETRVFQDNQDAPRRF